MIGSQLFAQFQPCFYNAFGHPVGELDDAIVNGAPKVAAGVTAQDELPAEPSSLTEAASRDHDAQSGSFTLKPRPSTEQGAAAAAASARAEADDRPGPAAAEDQPTGEQQQEEEKEEEQQQAAGAAAQAAKAVPGVSQVRRNDILGSTKGSMGRGAPVNPNAEVVRASDTADEVRLALAKPLVGRRKCRQEECSAAGAIKPRLLRWPNTPAVWQSVWP